MKDNTKKIYLLISCTLMLFITLGIVFASLLPVFTVSAEKILDDDAYSNGRYTKNIIPKESEISILNFINFFSKFEYANHITNVQNLEKDIRDNEKEIEKLELDHAKEAENLRLQYTNPNQYEILEQHLAYLEKQYNERIAEKQAIIDECNKKIGDAITSLGDKKDELNKLLDDPEFLETVFFSYAIGLLFEARDASDPSEVFTSPASTDFTFANLIPQMGSILLMIILLVSLLGCILFTVIRLVRYFIYLKKPTMKALSKLTPKYAPVVLSIILCLSLAVTMNSPGGSTKTGYGIIVLLTLVIAAYFVKGLAHLFLETEFKVRNIINLALTLVSTILAVLVMFAFSNVRLINQMYENAEDFVRGDYYTAEYDKFIENGEKPADAASKAKFAANEALHNSMLPVIIFEPVALIFLCISLSMLISTLGKENDPKIQDDGNDSGYVIGSVIFLVIISLIPAIFFSVSSVDDYKELEKQGTLKVLFNDHEKEDTYAHIEYELLAETVKDGKAEVAKLNDDIAKADGATKDTLVKLKYNSENRLAIYEAKMEYVGMSESEESTKMILLSITILALGILCAFLWNPLGNMFPKSLLPSYAEAAPEATAETAAEAAEEDTVKAASEEALAAQAEKAVSEAAEEVNEEIEAEAEAEAEEKPEESPDSE